MKGYQVVHPAGAQELIEARRTLGEFTTLETITDGDAIYLNASGYIGRARANASGTMHAAGVAVQDIASGRVGQVQLAGRKYSANYNFSGFVGLNAYVSAASAGAILGTKPTASGQIVQQVGFILNQTTLQVSIGGAYQVGVVANFV